MVVKLRSLSRDEVRALDAQAASKLGLPTLILMENAGRGAAALLAAMARRKDGQSPASQSPASGSAGSSEAIGLPAPGISQALPRVLILCGPGNNGGDGAVMARHLDGWGYSVQVVWFTGQVELRGDAKTQYEILERSGLEQTTWDDTQEEPAQLSLLDALIARADWLVDGLLGTGLTRPVEGLLKRVVEAVNRSGKPVLALDLPSGLDANLGVPLGTAVRAQVTATFVAPKLGFSMAGARDYTGEVAVIDIGLPRCLLRAFEE